MARHIGEGRLRVDAWFDTRYALLTMTYAEFVILSRPRSGRVEGRTAGVPRETSLADAEAGEHPVEHILGPDLPRHLRQRPRRQPHVLGRELHFLGGKG